MKTHILEQTMTGNGDSNLKNAKLASAKCLDFHQDNAFPLIQVSRELPTAIVGNRVQRNESYLLG